MKFSEIEKELLNVANGWNSLKDDKIKINKYVPMKQKYGIANQVFDDVITVNKSGFATINRMMYDIQLHYLLVALYTDIEVEEDFSDSDCDFLIKEGFKKWLYKVTSDAYEFGEQVYKLAVIDKVREMNSSNDLNVDSIKQIVNEFNRIDPKVVKLAALDASKTNKAIREMVTNEQNSNGSK